MKLRGENVGKGAPTQRGAGQRTRRVPSLAGSAKAGRGDGCDAASKLTLSLGGLKIFTMGAKRSPRPARGATRRRDTAAGRLAGVQGAWYAVHERRDSIFAGYMVLEEGLERVCGPGDHGTRSERMLV
jgi:hypothetical protein